MLNKGFKGITTWGFWGAMILGILAAVFNLKIFLQSYLLGYIFWAGLSLGCLGFLMIHNLTGGGWGKLIRPQLEAGVATLPFLTLLFVPILIYMGRIYPWTHHDFMMQDKILILKSRYLNVPFFLIRNIFYFLVWNGTGLLLRRWSKLYEKTRESIYIERQQNLSAVGLVLFILTITFASFDWMISLDPKWHSSIYGAMVLMGFALSALSFMIVLVCRKTTDQSAVSYSDAKCFNDLGNLLLACVMLWAYMAFSQYLIIWNANLADEIPWYLIRSVGGWGVEVMLVLLFQFLFPFFYLLLKDNKRTPSRLLPVALFLLVVHIIDLHWLIVPAFSPKIFSFHPYHLLIPLLLGMVWMSNYFVLLQKRTA